MGSSRKKTYFAVMLLCSLAFAVDQLFLSSDASGPRQAAGAPTAPPDPSRPDPANLERPETVIPTLPFPFDVQKHATASLGADVFVPPSFRGANGVDSGAGGAPLTHLSESSTASSLDRTTFSSRYRLDGMISNQETHLVIIDGMWVRIGESIRGCRLVRIVARDAVFECFDGQAVLRFSYSSQGGEN